jgi:hypothetical protein
MVQLTLTENGGANREMVSVFFDAISGRRSDRPGAYMSSGVVDHDKFAHGAADVSRPARNPGPEIPWNLQEVRP